MFINFSGPEIVSSILQQQPFQRRFSEICKCIKYLTTLKAIRVFIPYHHLMQLIHSLIQLRIRYAGKKRSEGNVGSAVCDVDPFENDDKFDDWEDLNECFLRKGVQYYIPPTTSKSTQKSCSPQNIGAQYYIPPNPQSETKSYSTQNIGAARDALTALSLSSHTQSTPALPQIAVQHPVSSLNFLDQRPATSLGSAIAPVAAVIKSPNEEPFKSLPRPNRSTSDLNSLTLPSCSPVNTFPVSFEAAAFSSSPPMATPASTSSSAVSTISSTTANVTYSYSSVSSAPSTSAFASVTSAPQPLSTVAASTTAPVRFRATSYLASSHTQDASKSSEAPSLEGQLCMAPKSDSAAAGPNAPSPLSSEPLVSQYMSKFVGNSTSQPVFSTADTTSAVAASCSVTGTTNPATDLSLRAASQNGTFSVANGSLSTVSLPGNCNHLADPFEVPLSVRNIISRESYRNLYGTHASSSKSPILPTDSGGCAREMETMSLNENSAAWRPKALLSPLPLTSVTSEMSSLSYKPSYTNGSSLPITSSLLYANSVASTSFTPSSSLATCQKRVIGTGTKNTANLTGRHAGDRGTSESNTAMINSPQFNIHRQGSSQNLYPYQSNASWSNSSLSSMFDRRKSALIYDAKYLPLPIVDGYQRAKYLSSQQRSTFAEINAEVLNMFDPLSTQNKTSSTKMDVRTQQTRPIVSTRTALEDVMKGASFASAAKCKAVLQQCNNDVSRAIKELKTEELLNLGIARDRHSAEVALEDCKWDLNAAAVAILS
ncbi:hypothetical protein AB6A40_001993 [Gnathostoma spinigerum]|uniref:UBA domain-containing protein n=1 Tax=Gnathostoma spinigerum TaxID=75299 RepID=A0ABD6E5I2_9BILA